MSLDASTCGFVLKCPRLSLRQRKKREQHITQLAKWSARRQRTTACVPFGREDRSEYQTTLASVPLGVEHTQHLVCTKGISYFSYFISGAKFGRSHQRARSCLRRLTRAHSHRRYVVCLATALRRRCTQSRVACGI